MGIVGNNAFRNDSDLCRLRLSESLYIGGWMRAGYLLFHVVSRNFGAAMTFWLLFAGSCLATAMFLAVWKGSDEQ
jgi:hypothetical protein